MINTTISSTRISFSISAESEMVNHIMGMAEYFVRNNASSNIKDVTIVLRELLNNAIEHGCRNNKDGRVLCSLEITASERVKIVVEDDGEGFDFRQIDFSLPETEPPREHRGLILVHALSERIEFNGTGNRLTVFMNLKDKKQKQQT